MPANHRNLTMSFTVRLDPDNPSRVLMWSACPELTDEHGAKPGMKQTFSADPDSADFDVAYYNRMLRFLHAGGIALDVSEINPVPSRKLRDRWPQMSLKARRDFLRHIFAEPGPSTE